MNAPARGFSRSKIIDSLKEAIRAIESGGRGMHISQYRSKPPASELGALDIDTRLGCFDVPGVHEIKPLLRLQSSAAVGDRAAAFAFALRLTERRLLALKKEGSRPDAPVLWCWPKSWAREVGSPYLPGLSSLIEPHRLLFVETAGVADALWALEEALKSGSLALVVGLLDEVALTPARRLSLAAASGLTPCLLLTHQLRETTAATASRWRISAVPSAPHPFEPAAPANPCWSVTLERWRGGIGAQALHMTLEWSDATHCFHMASALGDRAAHPSESRPDAIRPAFGARR